MINIDDTFCNEFNIHSTNGVEKNHYMRYICGMMILIIIYNLDNSTVTGNKCLTQNYRLRN